MGLFDTLRTGLSSIGGALSSGFEAGRGFLGDIGGGLQTGIGQLGSQLRQEIPTLLSLGTQIGVQALAKKAGVNLGPSTVQLPGGAGFSIGTVGVPTTVRQRTSVSTPPFVPSPGFAGIAAEADRFFNPGGSGLGNRRPTNLSGTGTPLPRPVTGLGLGSQQPIGIGSFSRSNGSPLNLSGNGNGRSGQFVPNGLTDALLLSPLQERGESTTSAEQASQMMGGGVMQAGALGGLARIGSALLGEIIPESLGVGAGGGPVATFLPGGSLQKSQGALSTFLGFDQEATTFRVNAGGRATANKLIVQANPQTGSLNFWRHAGTLRGALLAGDVRNMKSTMKRARKLCGPALRGKR